MCLSCFQKGPSREEAAGQPVHTVQQHRERRVHGDGASHQGVKAGSVLGRASGNKGSGRGLRDRMRIRGEGFEEDAVARRPNRGFYSIQSIPFKPKKKFSFFFWSHLDVYV